MERKIVVKSKLVRNNILVGSFWKDEYDNETSDEEIERINEKIKEKKE
jgi:hypothetical protein